MSGKLKITGNVLASQKLHAIWENTDDDDDTEKASFAGADDAPPMKPVITDPSYQLGDVCQFEIICIWLISKHFEKRYFG